MLLEDLHLIDHPDAPGLVQLQGDLADLNGQVVRLIEEPVRLADELCVERPLHRRGRAAQSAQRSSYGAQLENTVSEGVSVAARSHHM
jgi:hypothetical protein